MEFYAEAEKRSSATAPRPQCARALLVSLDAGGQCVLQQVARRINELRPDDLTLVRFVFTDRDGNWQILNGSTMADHRLPEPVPPPANRQEAHLDWQERLAAGCQALQRAIFQVMDPDSAESLVEKGYDIPACIEIYLVGDLVDSLCSTAIIPLLKLLRERFLSDIPIVTSLLLSIARLSDLALSAHEQAMAYAALKELNFATSEAVWRPADGQPEWKRLIDHCYLVDQVSEGEIQVALPQPECVMEIIGGFLTGVLLSNLRTVEQAAYLFLQRWPGVSEGPEEVGAVASLGYAAVSMPLAAIAAYIGHLEARNLISGLLQPDEEKPPSEPAYPNLARELDLVPPAVEARLKQIEGGRSLAVQIDGLTIAGVPVFWADRLAQTVEGYREREWPQLLETLRANGQAETDRALNNISEAVDAIMHSQPAGWKQAQEMIATLDTAVAEWRKAVPDPTPVPTLEESDRALRRAVQQLRPLLALLPHLALAGLVGAWLTLTLPYGWLPGVLVVILMLAWLGWSYFNARRLAQRLAVAQIELYQSHFEAEFRNVMLRVITRLYRTIRETLGYILLPADEQDQTQWAALRRWRDALAVAGRVLAEEPVALAVTLPYGEKSAVRPEKYGSFYKTYTRWTPTEIAAEFLKDSCRRDPAWSWRRLDAGRLEQQSRAFCTRKYHWAFDQFQVDMASNLESDDSGPEYGLPAVLHQLRLRAEPLIRRHQHFQVSSKARQRFLLLHQTNGNPLVTLGQAENLVAVGGGPSAYLAIAQVELGVAIPDLLVIPALQAAYDDLPDKALAHGEPAWADLPDLQQEELTGQRPQAPPAP